jgi:hypothetical protein
MIVKLLEYVENWEIADKKYGVEMLDDNAYSLFFILHESHW